MASIGNASQMVLESVGEAHSKGADNHTLRDLTRRKAEEIASKLVEASTMAAKNGSKHLAPSSIVITHSFSSTIEQMFKVARSKLRRVLVTESRPMFEGRVLARSVRRMGVETVLLTDAAGPASVRGCDYVVVGADAVLSDGSIVNKTGTLPLALAAHEFKVPFLVLSDSSKITSLRTQQRLLEEHPPSEVCPRSYGLKIRNPYFERTPAHLVSSIITEAGPVRPNKILTRTKIFDYFRR